MGSRLEELVNEKKALETKMVQVQSMMLIIDSMIVEEMLLLSEEGGKAN